MPTCCVELAYQRDFSFIAPALKMHRILRYIHLHSHQSEQLQFRGRENEKDLSLPGSPEHTANASLTSKERF